MKKSTIVSCIAVLALSSCTTIQHTALSESVDTEVHNLTVADMNVSKNRVSHTFQWKWDPLSTVSLADKKRSAAAELLIEQGGDVLVEPQYVIKRRGIFRGGEITVSGYPATYRDFRSMTQADADIIATVSPKIINGGSPLAFVSNIFKPFGGAKAKAKKPRKARATQFSPEHQFVNLIGGPVMPEDGNFTYGSVGAMWGKTGASWGFYVKGTVAFDCKDNATGAVTIGALKRVSPTVNLFAGVGFGGNYTRYRREVPYYYENPYYGYGYWTTKTKSGEARVPAIPVDLGVQWRINRVNLLCGLTSSFRVKPETGKTSYYQLVNFTPFVGVGYCF